jgi:hypothetical protein
MLQGWIMLAMDNKNLGNMKHSQVYNANWKKTDSHDRYFTIY